MRRRFYVSLSFGSFASNSSVVRSCLCTNELDDRTGFCDTGGPRPAGCGLEPRRYGRIRDWLQELARHTLYRLEYQPRLFADARAVSRRLFHAREDGNPDL